MPTYDPSQPVSDMHCLLEQGLQCMGAVTRAGCAGKSGEAPRCILARVPCQGCFGPVKQDGNQLLDYLNALASNQIDLNPVTEKSTLLEFSGAHGLLRPKTVREGVKEDIWLRTSHRSRRRPDHDPWRAESQSH